MPNLVCSEKADVDVTKEAEIHCRMNHKNVLNMKSCFQEVTPSGWQESKIKEILNIRLAIINL